MNIAFATPTWIRTEEEGRNVLATLNVLGAIEAPIVVVDGGSSKPHQRAIQSVPNVQFFESSGFFSDRLIFAMQQAAQLADTIFYLQSDKLDFAQTSILPLIKKYTDLQQPTMLVASRTPKTFHQYPIFQQTQEEFLNFFVGDFVGIREDYFAGPKLFPSLLVPYLRHIQGEVGWGVEAFLYVLAKRLGLPFSFFPIDMRPPVDVENNEAIKKSRLKVTQWIIEGFLQAQRVDIDQKF